MTPALLLLGTLLLAAGTFRQSRQLWGPAPPARARRALLLLGGAAVAGSLLTLPDFGPALLAWFGLFTIAALATVALFWAWPARP